MDLISFSYYHYNIISSTNEIAKELAKNKENIEGIVVFADEQNEGKGVGETKWDSNSGENILTTFVLCPKINLKDQFTLNLLASVSVLQLIQNLNIKNAKIKWPNDILIENKKVAGILIENSTSGNIINKSFIGIGLNVNQLNFENDYNREPTSIRKHTNNEENTFEILIDLANLIANNYQILKTNPSKLYQLFIDNLYLMDQLSNYKIGEEKKKLFIRGISKDGKLVTEDENQNKYFHQFKQIQFLD